MEKSAVWAELVARAAIPMKIPVDDPSLSNSGKYRRNEQRVCAGISFSKNVKCSLVVLIAFSPGFFRQGNSCS